MYMYTRTYTCMHMYTRTYTCMYMQIHTQFTVVDTEGGEYSVENADVLSGLQSAALKGGVASISTHTVLA